MRIPNSLILLSAFSSEYLTLNTFSVTQKTFSDNLLTAGDKIFVEIPTQLLLLDFL